MSQLLKGIQAITPATPVNAPREYDGFELFRWKMFVFRPAEFKFEGLMLLVLGSYLALFFIGRTINSRRAREAYQPYMSLISSQFAVVRPLLASSPALHLLYATGRRNVLALHATLKLYPLHDVIMLAWQFGNSLVDPTYDAGESIEFDLTLGRGSEGVQDGVGVWAVVDKGVMGRIRERRFDMTYPRMLESAAMPITHALFAEHSDVTDLLLKTPNVGITELLAQPAATKVLKSFIVTDQPSKKPTNGPLKPALKGRMVTVSLRKPTSAADEAAVAAWLQVALNVADVVARPNAIKPEVLRKLLKTRAEVDAGLAAAHQKELAEDAGEPTKSKQEVQADKRLARKKAERATMSDKEIKKAEEVQRKREMKKMQKRGMQK